MSKLNIKLEENEKANMTPMIDVVFLLIIFFMLVSQFSNQVLTPGILLPNADQSEPDDGQDRRMVVNVDGNGKFTLRGVAYPPDALFRKIEAFGQKKRDEAGVSDMKVMIRGDRKTKFKHIRSVYKMLQDSKIWKVSFATQKE